MADFRLVAARKQLWVNEPWREPARLGLIIRAMEDMAANENENPESRAEAERLLPKLYLAGKRPPNAYG